MDKAEVVTVFIVVDIAAVAEVTVVDKDVVADKGDAVEVGVIKAIMMTVYTLLLAEILNSMTSAQRDAFFKG
jgi:hypothetical protein